MAKSKEMNVYKNDQENEKILSFVNITHVRVTTHRSPPKPSNYFQNNEQLDFDPNSSHTL